MSKLLSNNGLDALTLSCKSPEGLLLVLTTFMKNVKLNSTPFWFWRKRTLTLLLPQVHYLNSSSIETKIPSLAKYAKFSSNTPHHPLITVSYHIVSQEKLIKTSVMFLMRRTPNDLPSDYNDQKNTTATMKTSRYRPNLLALSVMVKKCFRSNLARSRLHWKWARIWISVQELPSFRCNIRLGSWISHVSPSRNYTYIQVEVWRGRCVRFLRKRLFKF